MNIAESIDIQAREENLFKAAREFVYDPLGFVMYAFPWGVAGTRLADHDGPDGWQVEILEEIGNGTLTTAEAIRIAVRSGHGIGKSALIAWIILWFMLTRSHPQIVVTANTKTQLTTKTWRELAKWHKLSVFSHWYEHKATTFAKLGEDDEGHSFDDTWFAALVPWSIGNTEAFAGTHEKHVLNLYDEASAIPDEIWNVTEGAMTGKDKHGTKIWVAFGNPTKPQGRFKDCFGADRGRWKTWEIDSRTAKMADKVEAEGLIERWGIDSDIVRVRVLGKTPRTGEMQLIGEDLVAPALGKQFHYQDVRYAPRIMGIDIARSLTGDQSVIYRRQGVGYYPLLKYRIDDTWMLTNIIAAEIKKWKPDCVFIDMGNVGAAIRDNLVNALKMNKITKIVGVWFGDRMPKGSRTYNKRADMWLSAKEFLINGGGIPDDNELRDDLQGPRYFYADDNGTIQLESKRDIKARPEGGLPSPDSADAFVLTFAHPVEIFNREAEERADEVLTETSRSRVVDRKKGRTYKSRGPFDSIAANDSYELAA